MADSKKIGKGIYKFIRFILFSLTLAVVGIYVAVYTLLAIPAFTNWVKDKATQEISQFLGAKVTIEKFEIYPFNEAKITGLMVYDQEGEKCLYVETIGAGIRLWKLISERKIDLTFGEIIGLDADIVQKEKDAPLNIDFIIKAFSGEEKKEKKEFELSLKNVVLRKSRATFRRPWLKGSFLGKIDLSHLEVDDLAADLTFPKISDKGVEVDLRRLSLTMPGITRIEKLGLKGSFSNRDIDIKDLVLEMPKSRIELPEFLLSLDEGESFKDAVSRAEHNITLKDSYLTPSEFAFLYPPLESFSERMDLDLSASGNFNRIDVDRFRFGNPETLYLTFRGDVENLADIGNLRGDISDLNLNIRKIVFSRLGNDSPESLLPAAVARIFRELGDLSATGNLAGRLDTPGLQGNLEIFSDVVNLNFEGAVSQLNSSNYEAQAQLQVENLKLGTLLPDLPFGNLNANLVADGVFAKEKSEGSMSLVVDDFEFRGKSYEGFSLNLNKEGNLIDGDLLMNNAIADVDAKFSGDIFSAMKHGQLEMALERLDLSELIDMKSYTDYIIAGNLSVDASGSTVDDIIGQLNLDDFSLVAPDHGRRLDLERLNVVATLSDHIHSINLSSDWFDLRAEGIFKFAELPVQLKDMAAAVFPSFIHPSVSHADHYGSNIDFDLLVKHDNTLPEFFNLPFRFLVPINLEGTLEGESNTATFTLDIPYLQQGKDKLIYDNRVVAQLDGNAGVLNALVTTTLPVKKGDLALNIELYGQNDVVDSDIHWINTENSDFRGLLSLSTELSKNEFTGQPEISTEIRPSVIRMGPQEWNIARSEVRYADKCVDVNGFKVWRDSQMVLVDGKASTDYQDAVKVELADINVDYIFDLLQINYVTFGGVATGEVEGRALLSGSPVAETEGLVIKQFTYNGAPLGQCVASSRWNNEQKKIEIGADISKDGRRIVEGGGGIWLGRDSLSFDIKAMKTPVEFVQPFMEAFSSHVGGFASGSVKLFGTFHDIDMTGRIFADSVAVKLDFTNVVYHGSDSVILYPGKIDIPHFTLIDKFGNKGVFSGELTHHYFHEPSFNFRLSEASNLLCYDTNSDLNPDWYGTLFGSGSALVKGVPGMVDISADMTVAGNSNFTFVLNDTQYAQDYPFLTFSDRRKKIEVKKDEPTPDDFKAMLKKTMKHREENRPTQFGIDIRASMTPQLLFTLVMDPAAGDKITARGRGAMQVKYESDDDEMTMYGKYEIDEGNYNFSLQDIILRDFKIKEGSSISFNGNPLAAHLDISATYRVNTNLTDLDKSFSTDRELNRTNVPVDAVLSVEGNMQQPDITFDIELPTLTQDVERKVKSIISTDDMMNRQIIYLLALNRFYTPEYMGSGSNGGEWTGIASSTISSQLSNMLGQLTDKFSVSPSFRSDKGDFSDIEVDVALSSKLLNNRLLINGNFGYRDRSNSSTTFVGDFDVEYLLNKNGNLRLKAYNHFNDQNYYLREALTTQGLGVVYRKDFDNWFTFLKKRRPKNEESASGTEDGAAATEKESGDETPSAAPGETSPDHKTE